MRVAARVVTRVASMGWPLGTAMLALFFLFFALKSPVRDALEVSVQAAEGRVRNLLGGVKRSGETPRLQPDVQAFLDRERTVSMGGWTGAWIVQVIPGEDRFHVVVDRGQDTGIRPGDLAVFFTRPGGPASGPGSHRPEAPPRRSVDTRGTPTASEDRTSRPRSSPDLRREPSRPSGRSR